MNSNYVVNLVSGQKSFKSKPCHVWRARLRFCSILSYQNHLWLSALWPRKAQVVPLPRPVDAVVAVGELQDVRVKCGPRVGRAKIEGVQVNAGLGDQEVASFGNRHVSWLSFSTVCYSCISRIWWHRSHYFSSAMNRPHPFNWGLQSCLRKLCTSSVHPMSSSWHYIGCIKDKCNGRQIRNPQLKGRGLAIKLFCEQNGNGKTLQKTDMPVSSFGDSLQSPMFRMVPLRRPVCWAVKLANCMQNKMCSMSFIRLLH